MGHLLVHLCTGPENPTRAALALLVARTATDAGHRVDVFLAGDAVGLLRPATAEAASGIGTGNVAEHLAALASAGVRLHASGLSSKARALGPDDVGTANVTFAPPDRLVELAMEADRVLTY
jgi:predicted peroxiredoxin